MSFVGDMLGLTPDTPDYAGAAQATAEGNKALTLEQTYANRPNVHTPWGSQSWSTYTRIDPSTNKPVTGWTQNTQLNPLDQKALNAQRDITLGRSEGAKTLLNQAVQGFQQPMDWGSMPARASNMGEGQQLGGQYQDSLGATPEEYRRRGEQAVLNFNKPIQDAERGSLEAQLANQGLARGSEAWNREMQRMSDQHNRNNMAAFSAGQGESQQMFNQGLQSGQFRNQAAQLRDAQDMNEFSMGERARTFNNTNRGGAVNEQTIRRGMSLNELNALLTGQQVGMPDMPSNMPQSTAGKSQAADLMGAMQNSYQANLNTANAGNAFAGNAMMMFSDARLKTDIRSVATLPSGIEVVQFRYAGDAQRRLFTGVIAQQVQRVRPGAVHRHRSGFLMVNLREVLQ